MEQKSEPDTINYESYTHMTNSATQSAIKETSMV